MNIDGVSFVPGSRKMSNQAVIEEVRKNSAPHFDGNLEQALSYVNWMMESTKVESRWWFDHDERPLDAMVAASHQAMAQAGCGPQDIDLVIYTGNTRGFIEPGDSYFVAQALGMDSADCFDILDACMAWTRACDVVQSHLTSGRYRRALIVNCESYFEPGGFCYPSNFQLTGLRDIAHCFSAYCGGDGASATVLSAAADKPWKFNYISVKSGVDLCTVPLPGYERRSPPSAHIGKNGMGHFTSFSSKVFNFAEHAIECLERLAPHRDRIKMLFPHTGGSVPEYQKWADRAGFGDLIKYIFPRYGNLGSASIPAAISIHMASGELKRGDEFAIWVASSGLSFASASIRL